MGYRAHGYFHIFHGGYPGFKDVRFGRFYVHVYFISLWGAWMVFSISAEFQGINCVLGVYVGFLYVCLVWIPKFIVLYIMPCMWNFLYYRSFFVIPISWKVCWGGGGRGYSLSIYRIAQTSMGRLPSEVLVWSCNCLVIVVVVFLSINIFPITGEYFG